MPPDTHRKPVSSADMAQGERAIRRAGVLTLLALGLAVPLAWFGVPRFFELPVALPERLAFAAQASAVVLACVVVAVLIVSTVRRFSPQDNAGSAAGPPSPRLAIYAAFLQNTLEQAVIASGLYFALAALVGGAWLSLIPVGVVFFVVGRILFLRGYAAGVKGRALGMALTMTPTVLGYVLVLPLLVWQWF